MAILMMLILPMHEHGTCFHLFVSSWTTGVSSLYILKIKHLSTNGVGRSGELHAKKLDHQITPYTKINSRWMKNLNISCDTIKVLEENIGRKISDISHSGIFTDMSPRARDVKERINKWDLIKIRHFCMAKENSG